MQHNIGVGWFPLAVLASLTLVGAAYSNHFQNELHFDDTSIIENNISIRSLGNIPRFFVDGRTYSTTPRNMTYRPVVSTTFAIDYAIAGVVSPRQFHRTQFGLHLLLATGLYLLFLRILNLTAPRSENRFLALFAATLFAVHTGNTETLNYMSARSDLLSTLGIVASFILYLYVPRSRRLHLYVVPAVVGAFAKTPGVMFAPLFLVYLALFDRGHPSAAGSPSASVLTWRSLSRGLPPLLACFVAFVFVEAMNPPIQDYAGGPVAPYLRTQLFAWVHYARLFVLPLGLSADSDWSTIPHWHDTRVFAGVCFLGLLLWAFVRTAWRPEYRPVAFGIAWFGLGLLPSSSLFPLTEVINEHRIYLPYIGLSLATVWLAHRVLQQLKGHLAAVEFLLRPVYVMLAASLLLANAIGTFVRNRDWRTEETLWTDVVEKSPNNGRAWMNFGLTQMEQGRLTEARAAFERAREIVPLYEHVYTNLGIVNAALGEADLAEASFIHALDLDPGFPGGHHFYARWLLQVSRGPEAIGHFRQAIELAPNNAQPRSMLQHLYAALGAHEALRQLAEETLRASPGDLIASAYAAGSLPLEVEGANDPAALFEAGLRLIDTDRNLDGAIVYRRGLDLDPSDADAYNNYGWAMSQLGFYDVAQLAFAQALVIQPGHERAAANLTWVQTR